jgi:hypothetical protein
VVERPVEVAVGVEAAGPEEARLGFDRSSEGLGAGGPEESGFDTGSSSVDLRLRIEQWVG